MPFKMPQHVRWFEQQVATLQAMQPDPRTAFDLAQAEKALEDLRQYAWTIADQRTDGRRTYGDWFDTFRSRIAMATPGTASVAIREDLLQKAVQEIEVGRLRNGVPDPTDAEIATLAARKRRRAERTAQAWHARLFETVFGRFA